MKRALVMSGGGSRGAYECGAWQALAEMDMQFDAVYGTSIGAINAALVAQGDLDAAVRLWDTVTPGLVLGGGNEENFTVGHMITSRREIVPFLLENAKNFQRDITPLCRLMEQEISEARIRKSGREMGVMVTRFPQISGRAMRLRDIPEGQLLDYVIASASCFPVFPTKEIDSERYIDGGFTDNMPIGMAIADGADEIIAVDIHPEPVHPEYNSLPILQLINPIENLGNFLDFNPQRLRINRMCGYYDTMKTYGRYSGYSYTFSKIDTHAYDVKAHPFVKMIAAFDAAYDLHGSDAVLFDTLRSGLHKVKLTETDVYLRGLEMCASAMDFRRDIVYDAEKLTGQMLRFAKESTKPDREKLFRMNGRELLVAMYAAVQDAEFVKTNAKKLMEHPQATIAAMFLNSIEGQN